MRRQRWVALGLSLLGAAAPQGSALAQDLRPTQLMVCAGCHNPEPGTLAPAEAQAIPRLGGQQAEYLREALAAYRTRQRDHFYMRGMAAGLKGEDLEQALKYLSRPEPLEPHVTSKALVMPQVAARCVACHGSANQAPATPQTPVLSGQHAPYLEAAFVAYATDRRRHPVMTPQARDPHGVPSLDAEQLREVAQWFAAMPGLTPR